MEADPLTTTPEITQELSVLMVSTYGAGEDSQESLVE